MRHSSIRSRDDGRAARRVLAMPAVRRNAWFADEVAIDFPSLAGAIERMRESFIAASADETRRRHVQTDLYLSAREAFEGVEVPLDVPVRKLCPACGGRGEIWSDPCESCGGRGDELARHPVRLVVPPRVQHGDRFSLSVAAPSSPLTCVEVRVVLS